MKATTRTALVWRCNGPHVEGIPSVRLPDWEAVDGAQVYDPRTARRTQKEGRAQSQQARPEAQDYATLGSFRRPGFRSVLAGNPPGPEQVFVRQAASDDAGNRETE